VNEPATEAPDDNYAMDAANTALVDLEVNKDAENPFRVQAKAAIARGDTVCHDVARNQGQIYDNVKHMPWFVDAVAEELEANPVEEKPVTYTNDETPTDDDEGDVDSSSGTDDGYHECLDCEGEFADEDCHAVDKGFVCEGCYRKRGPTEEVRQAVYAERIAAGLSPAEAAGHAWPENKEDEELLRRELADDAINEATAAALYARPMEMTIEVDPENILDGSDPRDQKLGEQSRQIAKLTQDLKEANNATAYHQRLYESRQRTSGQLSNTVSQLQEEIREWQSEDRKKARRIRDLETILRASATYITKHRPRQPTAKSKNFDALAKQLMAAADKDKKPKGVAKPAAKKVPVKKKR